MRGSTARQTTMSAVADPDDLIPEQHPIRRIGPHVEAALQLRHGDALSVGGLLAAAPGMGLNFEECHLGHLPLAAL